MSYAATFTIDYSLQTNHSIKDTFVALETAILAAGWVLTSDTGQTDPSTIVNGVNNNTPTNYGYRVYKTADALAGSNPIRLKIEFASASQLPTFYATVGTNSDGAGNISGNQSPRMYFEAGSGNSDHTPDTSHLQNAYLSGDGVAGSAGLNTRLAFTLCDGPTRIPGYFLSIERSVTTAGVDNNSGIYVFAITGNQAASNTNATPDPVISMCIPYAGTVAGWQQCWPSALNNTDAALTEGSTVGALQPVPFNFIPYPPGKNCLLYYGSDFPEYATQSVTNYEAHTYLALNQQNNASPTGFMTPYTTGIQIGSAFPAAHILFRYE